MSQNPCKDCITLPCCISRLKHRIPLLVHRIDDKKDDKQYKYDIFTSIRVELIPICVPIFEYIVSYQTRICNDDEMNPFEYDEEQKEEIIRFYSTYISKDETNASSL